MRGGGQKSVVGGQRVHARLWLLLLIGLALNCSAQEELPKLNPPLGEIPPTFWEQHGNMVVGVVVLALILMALGIWLWLRPKPSVPVPPEVEARKALEALANRPEDGAVLSRVSQILRRYVQIAFELPAGEPTTTEFCRQMEGHERMGKEFSGAIAEFLHQCDSRKFAREQAPAQLGAVKRARELVQAGEVRLAELGKLESAQKGQPVGATA